MGKDVLGLNTFKYEADEIDNLLYAMREYYKILDDLQTKHEKWNGDSQYTFEQVNIHQYQELAKYRDMVSRTLSMHASFF